MTSSNEKIEVSMEIFDEVYWFLARAGDGYIELSRDKVEGEYRYFKAKARDLYYSLHDDVYSPSPQGETHQ